MSAITFAPNRRRREREREAGGGKIV